MTTEVFLGGLVCLSVAALIIVAMTTNKEQQAPRGKQDRSAGGAVRRGNTRR